MLNQFLQFYGQHQISPVSQNLDDLESHFARRIGLYRSLGLAASLFEGREVLEVAPGSGHNSIVTATFKPKGYDLLEPNPTGFKKMVALFEEHRLSSDSVRFLNLRLEDFQETKAYDIVMCEGLIPGLGGQDAFLRQLALRVRQGGILVLTCADSVSVFFESLRRYLARLLVRHLQEGPRETARLLLPAFQSHLESLQGMSRPPEDWIMDNLLNPAAASLAASQKFSVEKCFDFFGDDFYFYGSSPVFMSNWNWYKKLPPKVRDYNAPFAASFLSQRPNFLHYEELANAQPETVECMSGPCKIFSARLESRTPGDWAALSPETIDQDLEQVRRVQKIAAQVGLPRSVAAFAEFLALFEGGGIPDAQQIAGTDEFRRAFGRGQQYLSLVKA